MLLARTADNSAFLTISETKKYGRQTPSVFFGGAKLYTHALRGSVVGKDKLIEEKNKTSLAFSREPLIIQRTELSGFLCKAQEYPRAVKRREEI